MILEKGQMVCLWHNSTRNAKILEDIGCRLPRGSKFTVKELMSYDWRPVGPTEVIWWNE